VDKGLLSAIREVRINELAYEKRHFTIKFESATPLGWRMDSRTISGGKPADGAEMLDSRQQPVWHVIVLGFFTWGFLYLPWWVFKTYRDLKRECEEVNGVEIDPSAAAAGIAPPVLAPVPARNTELVIAEDTRETLRIFGRVNPGLRGIGTLVPFLNLYLMTTLTIGICSLVPDASSLPRRKPLLSTLLILGGVLAFLTTAHLPGLWFIVSFLSMIPIAVLQHWLNQYWARVESPSLLVRHGFNVWEMLVIILGAGLTGLVVAGDMIGVKPH
jgi:hypothetical protein